MSASSPSINLSHLRASAIRELKARGIEWPLSEQNPARYQSDPVGFFREVLKADPWTTQEAILNALAEHKRVVVRSCHHSGKTWAAAGIVQWFVRAFDPSLVITTAGSSRQVEKQLWNEIAQHQARAGLGGQLLTMSLTLSPSQRAIGFTTDDPIKFQGWHAENILFVVDEASGVPPAIYEAIEGCLTGGNAKLLLIGNPNNPSGTFYEAFRSDLYQKFHVQASDIPKRIFPTVDEWIEERRQEWGEASATYQVRVLGNFPDQGENALISMKWAEEAQERDGDGEGAIEVGVDVARYGGDELVAYVRQGNAVVASSYWRGNDTMASAGRVAAIAREHQATAIKVDEIGVGAGVLDRLKEEFSGRRVSIVGVNVGEAARDREHYFNKRTEIFFGLRERFRDGEISIPKADGLLLDQLVALKFDYTPKGQYRLQSKDDLRKERGSHLAWQSPDRADALALCFAAVGPGFVPFSLKPLPRS